MKLYFYLVEFEYATSLGTKSILDLGVFSTRKKALEKIAQAKIKEGFRQYSEDCFTITKFGVEFDKRLKTKSGIRLYWVYHEYHNDQDSDLVDTWIDYGYYSRRDIADMKIVFLKKHTRLGKRYPHGFDIAEVIVDNNTNWSEGFTTC